MKHYSLVIQHERDKSILKGIENKIKLLKYIHIIDVRFCINMNSIVHHTKFAASLFNIKLIFQSRFNDKNNS